MKQKNIILEPAFQNLMADTLAGSLNADQIQALAQMLKPDFDIHAITGKATHVTVGAYQSANEAIICLDRVKKIPDLIKLMVEINGNRLLGKEITISGINNFLLQLAKYGYCYDFEKRLVVPIKDSILDTPNWGALKDGKDYYVTVASMDIVGSSELVRKLGRKKMEDFYSFYWSVLKERIVAYDGRIWSWAGDGGILAFAFSKHETRAVRFAIEIQKLMPLINTHERNPIDENIAIRIAMHSGKVGFMMDTGKIISDVINLAAHLEKKGTGPGQISVTSTLLKKIQPRLQKYFIEIGEFEGELQHRTENRLDLM